jgi:hypothetical protein
MAELGEPPSSSESSPTPELLQRTFADLRELVQIEVSLAKHEAAAELRHAKTAAVYFVVAFALGICAVNLGLVALFLALGAPAALAALTALAMAAAACAFAAWARARLPKSILADTRKRLADDINRLKEHAA